jgi:SAM-dependent methyltransferase
MLEEYGKLRSGLRVLDIGCGPGYVASYLNGCTYVGFDIDERYIQYAQSRYSDRHTFYCRPFDSSAVNLFDKFDLVLMNGLLHHLPDDQARDLINHSQAVLNTNGLLLTLDGCYQDGQSPIARFFLDKDRGVYVREAEGYKVLVESVFEQVEIFIHSDFSVVPYTYIVTRSINA